MKKPLKVLSASALAAALSVSALTPVMAATPNQAAYELQEVVIEKDGKAYTISTADYLEAKDAGIDWLKEGGKFIVPSYIKSTDGKFYSTADYLEAKDANGNSLQEALKVLAENPENAKTITPEVVKDFTEGKPVIEEGNLVVKSVSSITETGVTVEFSSSEQDRTNVTVEVLNPAGEKVAVKAQNIKAGQEEATFEFKTALTEVMAGTWSIGEVTKEVEVKEVLEVASVSAINETTVGLKLPEKFEGDLKDKKVKLTAGEKELTATYVSTANGVASFKLNGEAKLVDATTYTTTADWATISNGEFVAKVATEYVASFEAVTTAITAEEKVDDKVKTPQNSGITFKAINQYGEEIAFDKVADLEVEILLNDVLPLAKKDIKEGTVGYHVDKATGVVTILETLAKDDTIKIDLTNSKKVEDKKQELATASFDYTVGGPEVQVATSIYINAAKTSLPAKEGTDLKVNVLDQFNNTIKDAVTFVVNGKVVTPGPDTDLIQLNAGKYTFKTTTPGEYKVVVTVANNTKIKAETTITVGAATLTGLTVEQPEKTVTEAAKRFNKGEITIATVAPSEGAALVAENIKFNVTSTTAGVTAADVAVKAEKVTVGTGADAKEVIVIKATTDKKGIYTVTPYVGELFTATGVATGSPITFETITDKTVDSISDVIFDAKELKIGQEIKKEIVFKNKYGEVLTADEAVETITVTGTVFKGDNKPVIEQGTKETNDADKTYLVLTADKAGKTQVTVQANDAIATYTLDFKAAELATVTAGKNVSGVVAGDRPADVKVASHNDKAKYNELKFIDQDGKEFKLAEGATIKLSATGKDKDGKEIADVNASAIATLGKYTPAKDDKTSATFVGDSTKDATHIQVLPAATVKEGTYTVTVEVKQGEKEAKATFNIEVGGAREAKTVELKTDVTKVVLNGEATTMITVKDQYGALVEDAADKITVTPNNGNVAVVKQSGIGVKAVTKADLDPKYTGDDASTVVGYKLTLVGKAKGTSEITVAVKESDKVLASAKQTITVDSTDNLIDSIEIKEVDQVNNSKEVTTTLTAVSKDAQGNTVNVAPADLSWSVKSVKDAQGNVLKLGTPDANGVITLTDKDNKAVSVGETPATVQIKKDSKTGVSTLIATPGLTVEVEVQAESKNLKTDTAVISLNGEAVKYTTGLAVATVNDSKDFENAGLEVEIGKEGKLVFTFTGKDQYGSDFTIVDGVTATTGDDTALKVDFAKGTEASEKTATVAGTLTVEALNADGGNVYAKFGNDSIVIKVATSSEFTKTYNDAKSAVALLANKSAFELATTDVIKNAETAVNALPEAAQTELQKDIDAAKKVIDDAKTAGTLLILSEKIAGKGTYQSTLVTNAAGAQPKTDATTINTNLLKRYDDIVKGVLDKDTEGNAYDKKGITALAKENVKINFDNIKVSEGGKVIAVTGDVFTVEAFKVAKGKETGYSTAFNITILTSNAPEAPGSDKVYKAAKIVTSLIEGKVTTKVEEVK